MKKSLLFFAAMLFAFVACNENTPSEEEGGNKESNVTWDIKSAKGILTLSGSGPMLDYASASDAEWNHLRNEIVKVIVEEGITTIGNKAFCNCPNLEEVSLPSTLKSIGSDAFSSTGLTEVTLPNKLQSLGKNAFYGCKSLASINFPASLQTIGEYCFNGCSELVQIDLSATSVKRIEEATFYNCKKVQKVLLPSVLQEIGKIAFSDCYVMNEFRVYKNVQYPSAVDLPSSLTTIGEGAFFNCKSLPYVGVPSSLKTIGDNAFQNCESLSNANLSGIKTVGKGAFNGCSKLTTANITSVTTLGDEVFSSCSSLTTVEGARSLVTIGDKAFYDCNQLATFDWSSSITSIGKQAFCKCGKLPNITIGANVATIGEGAFSGCESATTITINTNNTKLKRIEKSTFNHAGFSELTIPASVEYIGKDALIVNRGITVTCLRKTTPTELEDEGAYWRYKEQNTLIVPSGTKAAYRASSHWTNYFGIVKEQ